MSSLTTTQGTTDIHHRSTKEQSVSDKTGASPLAMNSPLNSRVVRYLALGLVLVVSSFVITSRGAFAGVFGQDIDKLIEDTKLEKEVSLFTIALNGFNAADVVRSARSAKRGRFNGGIYIVGDQCVPAPDPKDATLIDVGNHIKDGRQFAKHFKQQLFDLVPAHVERAFYLDADMKINKPLHLFFAEIGPWDPECSAYMFKERWYTKSEFNAGTIYLDRTYSKDFLAAWKAQIEAHPEYGRDQFALMDIMHDSDRFKICPMPPEITFVADWVSRHSLRGIHSTTFTHWTSYKPTPAECHFYDDQKKEQEEAAVKASSSASSR